jgi:hypothetical protein
VTARQLPQATTEHGPQLRDDVPPPEVLAPEPPDVAQAMADHDATYGTDLAPAHTWLPADVGQAEWAMGMLRQLAAEQTALREQARLWYQQIGDWLARATAAPARRQAFFENALVGYAASWREQDHKRRTLHLPSGEVKATVPATAKVVIADEVALLDWLYEVEKQATPEGEDPTEAAELAHAAIKRTPDTVLLPQLRQLVKASPVQEGGWIVVCPLTGELPPGVRAEPPGPATYNPKPGQ